VLARGKDGEGGTHNEGEADKQTVGGAILKMYSPVVDGRDGVVYQAVDGQSHYAV
jgi:hypothetical protein